MNLPTSSGCSTNWTGSATAISGVVLKIETRLAFEHLPRLLLTAMRRRRVGVMIARGGDLAVEVGYERMAELQEETLCLCEAAHLPVIWATQVLEQLATTGLPSRAEISDAAMAERAECVMLNKGPLHHRCGHHARRCLGGADGRPRAQEECAAAQSALVAGRRLN